MILKTGAKVVRLVLEAEKYPNMIKYTSNFNLINITQTKYMIYLN